MKILNIIFITFIFTIFNTNSYATKYFTLIDDAEGYEKAKKEYYDKGKSLAVYFYVDNSNRCRKFNGNVLSSPKVKDFLNKNFSYVTINPYHGKNEMALANKYNINEYPKFFMFPGKIKNRLEINLLKEIDGDKYVISEEEFLTACKRQLAEAYSDWGFSLWNEKRYLDSGFYFKMALDYDPNSVLAMYGYSVYNSSLAAKKKDVKMFEKSEKILLTALKIKPDYKDAKEELKKVRVAIKNMPKLKKQKAKK